jgi:predicted MPP superfamily phosphohydrolase
VVVLLAEDVVRLVRWFGRLVRPRPVVPASADELPNGATEKIGRSEFLSRSALGLSLVPFGSIAHGMASGVYNYQVHEVEIPLSRLPQAFDGFTITHISDLHLGSLAQIPAALRGFELIRNLNSDMVLFTGDLVNNLASEALPWIDELKSITAPNGVVAALGNHDYGWHYPYFSGRHESDANFRLLDEVYKRAGWYLLKNFGFKLERDGECLGVAVTENWGRAARFPKRADLNKSLEGIEPEVCTIVLTHDPTFWDEHMLKHPRFFDLTLSGHTHGMQFGLETGGIKVSPVSFIYPRWAGLYQEQGQYLYVNRGFGFIGFPGRVGIYPEITRITLRCAPGRHAL